MDKWTIMWCNTVEEVEEIIKTRDLIYNLIDRTATRMISEERTSLFVLEIRCMEMVGSIWISLYRRDLPDALSRLLNWKVSREEYEDCARIKSMIDSLNSDSLKETDDEIKMREFAIKI